jgi:5-methyltetrahydropteroyltriglutamate--homocysteine methyltransferase
VKLRIFGHRQREDFMKRSKDRILTSHTGSVFLPPRDDHTQPEVPREPAAIKEAVRAIVDKQVEVGLDVINDGDLQFGLSMLLSLDRVFDGVENRPKEAGRSSPKGVPDEDMEVFAEYYERHPWVPVDFDPGLYVCSGPLGAKSLDLLKRDLDTLKEAAQGKDVEELFMCFISPGWLQEWIWNDHYGSEEEFVLAMGEAVTPYYKAIVEAGMVLQIDAPDIVDNWSWDRWSDVSAYRKNLETRLEAISNAISGLPEDRVRLHFCWGSWAGPHGVALPLEKVLDLVYRVPAQCYSVEAAKPNHTHEWRAFEEFPLPDGKIVMPGVIDHTTPVIEHPQVITDRIVAYAKVVGRENVIAGTDCGMRIDSRVEWAKLERMTRGAELASKELFG